jgi:hypothetical protein
MADDKEKQVSIRVQLPESTRNLLKGKSALEGKSVNESVLNLIEKYVADLAEKQKDKKD